MTAKQDKRIGRILNFITRLAIGKKPGRLFPTSRNDAIDGIIVGLKMMAEELQAHQNQNRQSQERLKLLAAKLFKIREEEKNKLSTNLHDLLGVFAVAATTQFSILREDIDEGKKQDARACLGRLSKLFADSISGLKKMAVDLRPTNLTILGLPGALREYLLEVSLQNGIRIEFEQRLGKTRVAEEPAITLYRIAQEAMSNIIRHARATKVRVLLGKNQKRLVLTISDDGKGMNPENVSRHPGKLGIIGMQERVRLLGGDFLIRSGPKKGTHVKVILPCS